jgi:pyruvate kinase
LTRVICTLGPASTTPRVLERLSDLGVDLFRINLSHTRLEDLDGLITQIQAHSSVPICLDTQGAQVRTGPFVGGRITLEPDTIVEVSRMPDTGTATRLPLYPGTVVDELRVGDLITVDFDSAVLQVIATGAVCQARVMCGGVVGSNKAVSVDCAVTLRPLTELDEAALVLGRARGLSHVALSFTNRRSDVALARELAGPGAEIISKVETRLALQNLDEILEAADAILIDRGDLSREVPLERIPLVQKDIIARANAARVPVYVATNLLESMITGVRPTRAEVNDVVNTLLDGADGLVLAAETAIGRNPVGCVSMIRSLIGQYETRRTSGSVAAWQDQASVVSGLVPPHGGRLVQAIADPAVVARYEEAPRVVRSVEADPLVLMDARQIATGAFSPLTGFMTRATLASVLSANRLPDGVVWPMPVLWPVPIDMVVQPGETLVLTGHSRPVATVEVDEVFDWAADDLARQWFGTDDPAHPGVARVLAGSGRFVGGTVALWPDAARQRLPWELTPLQARTVFEHRQWQRVVGFHTRNVPHRVHEYLQLDALNRHHCDGVFVHPVTGPKKSGDCTGDSVLRAYDHLIREHYPRGSALVAGWETYSRYAGPREALFTAIVRQNFGCSHFIVGRDHTGVGNFYSPEASRQFVEVLGAELGIQTLFSPEVAYCSACDAHVAGCEHGDTCVQRISGTEARDALRRGEVLPDWFMRESVSRLILADLRDGREVFVA